MISKACILTAGIGSRMGPMGRILNKALFPLGNRAILSHIVEKFPPRTHFVIALGFRGDQVRNYLALAHPDRQFTFVDVPKFQGEGSGPGFSLLCCRNVLQEPFFFVSSDTLWMDSLEAREGSWVGVARVPPETSPQYCNVIVRDGTVAAIRDKEHVVDPDARAFIGLCQIGDPETFWRALEDSSNCAGEHQVSNGLRGLLHQGHLEAREIRWTDVGDLDKYRQARVEYEHFDFSKPDEALYILGDRVIKFFADAEVAERRVRRAAGRTDLFPEILAKRGQFYCYAHRAGDTLYASNNPRLFQDLLSWLEENLWKPVPAEPSVVEGTCRRFYRDKTLERVERYHSKLGVRDRSSIINGVSVPPIAELLSRVPWSQLCQGIPVFFHGDLQFDNILYSQNRRQFTLLDWRQDFGGELEFGDLYYDLAKLYGGILLNYDLIKLNLLHYQEEGDSIWFDFGQRYQTRTYAEMLEKFVGSRDWSMEKVRLLTSLIYLNMSPLHHAPFDRLLYSLGRVLLHEALAGNGRGCSGQAVP